MPPYTQRDLKPEGQISILSVNLVMHIFVHDLQGVSFMTGFLLFRGMLKTTILS